MGGQRPIWRETGWESGRLPGGGGVKVRLPRNLHRFLFFISHKSIAGLPKRNMDLGRVGLLYWWHLALDREEGGANDGRPMADCNVQTTFFNYICKESIALSQCIAKSWHRATFTLNAYRINDRIMNRVYSNFLDFNRLIW